MKLASSESQTARAQIMNYENFVLAVWLYNNFSNETLENKKKVMQVLRKAAEEADESLFNFIMESTDLPSSTEPQWKTSMEAVLANDNSFSVDDKFIDSVTSKLTTKKPPAKFEPPVKSPKS